MKRFSFLMLAAAGLLFNACSDDTVVAEGGGQGEAPTEGYMALNINLPTTTSTRAENDVFDDGETEGNEYKVTDCALLLFEGTTENTATLFKAQDITLPFADKADDVDNDNITTSYKATATVTGRKTSGGKLYALVLLNYKNVMPTISAEGLPTFKIFKNDVMTTEEKGKTTTLADIRGLITKVNFITADNTDTKDYFFMTNAVLSELPGGVNQNPAPTTGAKVFQLAELDPRKIFDTKEKAEANPAGEVLVERAVAKATLSVATTATSGEDFTPTIGTTGLEIAKIEWAIDNMEPQSFIARNPGDLSYIGYKNAISSNYRFVGAATTQNYTSLGSDKNYYRTYWCIDPNYNVDAYVKDTDHNTDYMLPYTSSPYTTEGNRFVTVYPTTKVTPLYCSENTFDVEHQSYKNTTRAIIKVTLSDNAVFYSINGGAKTDLTGVKNAIMTYIVNNTDVYNAFKAGMNDEQEYTISEGSFDISYNNTATPGQYKVGSLEVKEAIITENPTIFKTNAKETIDGELAKLVETINKNVVAFEYKNGVMYYEARFQHFAGDGDADLAPWNKGESATDPAGGSTDKAYPDYNAANYLGRYGMVRNNWYDVVITAINGLGYPEIPSVTVETPGYDEPDTPDDNLKEHIAVKIHVLSWAKRTQSWNF